MGLGEGKASRSRIHKLKNKPDDRRIIMTAWTPADLKKMAKESKLASPSDVAGKSKEAVIDLIQRRAALRIESRRSDV